MFRNEDFEIDTLTQEAHTTLPQYLLKTLLTVAVGILITTVTSFCLYMNDFGLCLVYQYENLPIVVFALLIGCLLLLRIR